MITDVNHGEHGAEQRIRRAALGVGSAVWLLIMGAYAAALVRQRPANIAMSLLYNAPIAFLFLVLLAHMGLTLWQLGPSRFVRENRVTVGLWIAGAAILYLRLVSKSIEVSGHMAWLPLLTAQLWISAFPRWLIVTGVLATASTTYLKFVIFRGPSGMPGLIAGVFFATTLVLLTSRTRQDAGTS